MRRRALQGVLNSFLGTYTSRHADYEGYCVFGLLVGHVERFDADLTAPPGNGPRTAVEGARHLARAMFWDLVGKQRLPETWIHTAILEVVRKGGRRDGMAGGLPRPGHDMVFSVTATTDLGRTYRAETTAFIAFHDPQLELRRHEADWGVAARR